MNLYEMFIELLHSVFTRIKLFIVYYIDGRIKQEKQIFVLYFFRKSFGSNCFKYFSQGVVCLLHLV